MNDYNKSILKLYFHELQNKYKDCEEYTLDELLPYEQPTKYIVESENYSNNYKTPVLTAGKTFILGYTNEEDGIYDASPEKPVIIFDDFTTSSKYVDFRFKVKSSAMKILHISDVVNPKYIYYLMQTIDFDSTTHKRYWISKYSKIVVNLPSKEEQEKEVGKLDNIFKCLEELSNHYDDLIKLKTNLIHKLLDNYLYSDEYDIKTLDEVVLKTQNIKQQELDAGNEYLYVDLSSVDRSTHEIGETQKVSKGNIPSRAKQIIMKDDVLFGTTRPLLKRTCIVPNKYDNQLASTGFCILRADKEQVLPEWIYYNLWSYKFYDYIEPFQRGSNYPAVSDKQVKQYEITVPPIDIQKKYVIKLKEIFNLIQDI